VIQSYKDLNVYGLSYSLAMELFWLAKKFPKEERYSLTDQLLRASRSVTANIVEGWAKRHYENVFKRHLLDSIGSCDETKLWLDFALDCKYIMADEHKGLLDRYEELGKMLHGLFENWKTYKK
jgi:four helix bundle protein